MTILLIAGIVFLIVWLKDREDKKTKNEQYKKSTITNIQLERNIEIKWLRIIDEKLKTYSGSLNAFDYLMTLFDEYEIPKIRWNEPTNLVHKTREKALQDFSELEKYYDFLIRRGLGKNERVAYYREPLSPPYFCDTRGVPIYECDDEIRLWAILETQKRRYLEYENVRKRNHDWFTRRYIEINISGLTAYNHIINSDSAFLMYAKLINLLTHKELKSQGFNPSPDGEHESKWQEAENTHNRFTEEDKKYSWLKV